MKDGRTHMAHKAEHAVDTDTGALVAVTLQPADRGDTSTIGRTLPAAQRNVKGAAGRDLEEAVLDKGYHSDDVLTEVHERGVRGYVAEPERGRRTWAGKGQEAEQKRLYANRRRLRGRHGQALQRKRAELAERSFAHLYETGAMRRVHLRGRRNILKRLVVHGAGFNLALLLRKRFGVGKPRQMQGCVRAVVASFSALLRRIRAQTYVFGRILDLLALRPSDRTRLGARLSFSVAH